MTDQKHGLPAFPLRRPGSRLADLYANIVPADALENLPVMNLTEYQTGVVDGVREDLESGKTRISHAPTGAGKALATKTLALPCPVCGARDWKASPAGRNVECLNCGVNTTVERLARTHRAENRRRAE